MEMHVCSRFEMATTSTCFCVSETPAPSSIASLPCVRCEQSSLHTLIDKIWEMDMECPEIGGNLKDLPSCSSIYHGSSAVGKKVKMPLIDPKSSLTNDLRPLS